MAWPALDIPSIHWFLQKPINSQVYDSATLALAINDLSSKNETVLNRFLPSPERFTRTELATRNRICAMLGNHDVDRPFSRVSQLMRHRPDLITVVTHPVHLAICLSFSPSTDYSSHQLGT